MGGRCSAENILLLRGGSSHNARAKCGEFLNMSRGQVWVQSGGRRGRRSKQQRRKLSAIRTWTPPLAEKQAPLDVGGAWKLLPLGAPHWWAQMQQNSNIDSQRQINKRLYGSESEFQTSLVLSPTVSPPTSRCLFTLNLFITFCKLECIDTVWPTCAQRGETGMKGKWERGKKGRAVWLSARHNKHRCSLWF